MARVTTTRQAGQQALIAPTDTRSASGPVQEISTETYRGAPPAGQARIERLILHSLDNTTQRLRLVDDEALLDERAAAFFADHISAAIRRADWRATFVDPGGEIPALCRQLLSGADGFVPASRQLATRLYDEMLKRPNLITPGDFVAAVFTTAASAAEDGSPRSIALLKLDPDDQRLEREYVERKGRLNVRIVAAENLLPTSAGIQKCALIRLAASGDGFEVTLLDNQAGPRSEGVAAFFYRGFLTAELAPSARRHTRLFLTASEAWVGAQADTLTPPQLFAFYRARREALAAASVDLAVFARAALPDHPTLWQDLEARLSAALFAMASDASTDRFVVDRATADPFISTVVLALDGGLQLKVEARLFDALAQVAASRDAEHKLRLTLNSLTLKEVTTR